MIHKLIEIKNTRIKIVVKSCQECPFVWRGHHDVFIPDDCYIVDSKGKRHVFDNFPMPDVDMKTVVSSKRIQNPKQSHGGNVVKESQSEKIKGTSTRLTMPSLTPR